MILTLDIGNTNIKTALFEGMEMLHYWRVSTNRAMSSDEYGILLLNLFAHAGVSPKQVEGIMISSVVPQINFTIEHMCRTYFGMEPHIIGPGIKTGINIRYENPRELGSDRIANAVAGPMPLIIPEPRYFSSALRVCGMEISYAVTLICSP